VNGEYVEGLLAPVDDELEFSELPVEGEIPEGLRGTYLRNGPNPAFQPHPGYHLWDGDGMVHALTFGDEGVSYRNRWVRTEGLALERKAGRALFGGLQSRVTPPPELVGDFGAIKNVANTAIVRHAGRYLALWEAGHPTVLTPELDTVGTESFAGRLKGPMTAHPKIDPENGELLFFGYSAFPPYLRYHEADAAGKLLRSVEIDLPGPVMMHDFVTTRDHAVFIDSPAVFDFSGFVRGDPMIRWQPELGTRIGAIPRGGSADDIRWIELDSCYVFHFLNAWSEGDRIHITGCASDWLVIDYKNEVIPDGVDHNAYLHRFTLDLAAGTCKKERIGELPGEFPKLPDALAGLKNRYGYLTSFSSGIDEGVSFDTLTKVDLETGSETHHFFGRDKVVGEPAFAPAAGGRAEDDGWIVSYVHEADGSASEFVVLDARNLADEPVARIPLPRRVPVGFHGNWITPER
jgi:carotenoid cleavage dioxygenase